MEESTDGNLDLLSAALNQSGLMNFDLLDMKGITEQTSDELTAGLQDDPLLNALSTVSPGLLLPQKSLDNNQNYQNDELKLSSNFQTEEEKPKKLPTIISTPATTKMVTVVHTPPMISTPTVTKIPTIVNNPTGISKPIPTTVKTLSGNVKPSGVKPVVLGKTIGTKLSAPPNGAKIIKIPFLKAGSVIKINKLGKTGVIKPMSLEELKSKSLLNKLAETKASTSAPNIMNATKVSLSNQQMKMTPTNVVSQYNSVNTPTSEQKVFKKLTVRGKSVFVPVSKNDELLRKLATMKSIEVKQLEKQPLSVSSNSPMSYRVTLQNNITTTSAPANFVSSGMNVNVNSPRRKDLTNSKPLPETKSFNLGSLFVETVEKAVESDFETPPGSPFSIVLPQQEDQIVGKIVPNPLNLGVNQTSSIINSTKFYSAKIKSLNESNKQNHTFTAENFLRMKSHTIMDLTREKNQIGNTHFFEKQPYFGKDATMRSLSVPMMKMRTNENVAEEEEREEESTMQHAQTYAEYMPSKLNFGLCHPDSVVETSSLASIMPPDVRYDICIPQQTIDQAKLSALQLESIVYACQKHEIFLPGGERAGFLIGDGAGVGKGRTIAGIIYENYLQGRKRSLWFSVSNDLKYDAERDLRDIGAKHIKVYALNKFQYGKISSKNNGAVKKGVIFVTYSSLIGESHSQAKYHTRLKQLLHWCGDGFDGPVILDECHKAKNLVPSASGKSTKTGATVLKLQNQLPNARVVYASATGASEPRHMAYMSRLGLWGPGTSFPDFMDFIQAVDRRGVGAMELVAMDMKLRGSYIARQLSFYGVSFRVEEVALESQFVDMYNKSVRLWVIAREAFQVAASMIEAEHHMKKTMWGQFWSAHQRFFKYLCISAKVNHTVALVREAVKHGKCCVIGLQSTGEARTVDQLEKAGGELDDFVSTAKAVFENLIERHFPAPDRKRVTELFGKDFYNRNKEKPLEKKKINKRKRISNGKTHPNIKKQRRGSLSSNNDDGASSTSESANEGTAENDELSSEESDIEYSDYESDSACTSDEDIGKLFGNGSDSEDCESPKKSKHVRKKKRKREKVGESEPSSPPNNKGLNLEDLQSMNRKDIELESKAPAVGLLESLDSVSGTLTGMLPGSGPVERAQALKSELLDRLETLGNYLPNNMLDELIDALGGPENVAEMTGRKGRIVSKDDGSVEYQTRAESDIPVELLNLTEKQRFMDGEKNIAIISEAASSGISLQSDKRARNRRRRVHITLELPWSADRAIQQFGRTHRSNQVNAPEYVFMISELAGEQRFASVVAKRLESLGALTHGDRRASESRDLSKYNYDNKYGRKALESIMKAIAGYDAPLVPPPSQYPGHFFKDMRQALLGVGMITRETGQLNYILEKDYNNIFKFMNRMLGMEVNHQNGLFVFFADTLKAIIQESKRLGQYDQGIVDLGTGSNSVEKVKSREFPILSCGHVSLHTVRIERGTDWTEAKRIFDQCSVGEHSGFYTSFQTRNDRQMVMLAIQSTNRTSKNRDHTFVIYRPNTGKQIRRETLAEIEKKYKSVTPAEVEQGWTQQHDASYDQCSHQFWQGACSRGRQGTCHVGMRRRTYHVLGGSVLGVWRIVEHVLSMEGGNKYKMQVVRLQTSDGGKLVGLLIPSLCVLSLINALTAEANSASLQTQHNDATSHVRHQVDDVMVSEESDGYEEVEDFEPDEMLSGVLVPRQQYY